MNNHTDLVVSQTDPRPMYLQIIEQIRERIAVGDWPRGSTIPSIRQLAIDLRVSVITVKRAYLELERDGVIFTHQGKGSIVAAAPEQESRLLHEQLGRTLDEAARLGTLLGIDPDSLAERLHEAAARHTEDAR